MKTVLRFKDQKVSHFQVEHTLEYETMKKEIETRIVEHVGIVIGERNFDAWLCEEGLLRDLKPEAIMMHNGKPYNHLAGTVLVSLTDDDGYACGLSVEDVEYIKSNLRGANITVELDNGEFVTGDYPLFKYQY